MTNCNLQDFQNWLEDNLHQKMKANHKTWEYFFENADQELKLTKLKRAPHIDIRTCRLVVAIYKRERKQTPLNDDILTPQEWLGKRYPNKEEIWEIIFPEKGEIGSRVLGNNLLIADFPNLQKIIINGTSSRSARPIFATIDSRQPFAFEIDNCEIKNCPRLKEVNVSSCQVKNFVTDDSPNLNFLSLYDNLLTELDISKFPNLLLLNCEKNYGLKPISVLIQKIQARERAIVAPQIRDKNIAIQQLEWEKSELRREMISLDNIRIGEFNAKK